MRGDTVFMQLSSPASAIRVISQNGLTVDSIFNASGISYVMTPEESLCTDDSMV